MKMKSFLGGVLMARLKTFWSPSEFESYTDSLLGICNAE